MGKVYTPFPLFQWFGQNDKYDFAIYEVMPNQTAEDAVRNIVQFKKTDITGTSFLYPSYAEKLVNGKVYAWQIQGKVISAKGTQYLPSEVFRFQYADVGNGGANLKNIARVQIVPQEINLAPGQQFQFTVMAYAMDSSLIQNVTTQWQLSPADKGSISPTGLFTAGKNITTLAVVINAGAVTDFATVNIFSDATLINATSWSMGSMFRQLFGLQ